MFDSRVSRGRAASANGRRKGADRPRTEWNKPAAARTSAKSATAATVGATRPLALLVTIVLISGALVSRLVFWQVLQNGHLSAMASVQHQALVTVPATRGVISDSAGTPLAMDVLRDAVYVVPREMKDPTGTANLLSPILGIPVQNLNGIFSEYPGDALLATEVSNAVSNRIAALHLPGVVLTPELQRTYPGGSLASQVVGFVRVGTDSGQAGIEQYFNGLLSGRAGLNSVLHDTAGDEIRMSPETPSLPQSGGNVRLSIDSTIQSLAEHDLQAAVRKYGASGGKIIVMDPNTGFITALAATPTFDPDTYGHYPYATYANPAIQWQYEPGSTFKIITMAAGLDAHVITPQTAFEDTGNFPVGGVVLHNWTGGAFGWETMTQVLQHSANVGAAWVSSRLGLHAFYKYVKAFGFGRLTGITMPGEIPGSLPLPGQKGWTIVNQFTNSFGQGIDVTPLQLITAVSAVANGGMLMKPQIVNQISYRGRVVSERPVEVRRVISPAAAHTLTDMLVHSAIGGEASYGLVKGYNIAAKTGTANIANPNGPGYLSGQGTTIASITGYAPAYHPRFVALVVVDRPKYTPWGSMAAAPVLHQLFKQLFDYYHIPPSPHALNQ